MRWQLDYMVIVGPFELKILYSTSCCMDLVNVILGTKHESLIPALQGKNSLHIL